MIVQSNRGIIVEIKGQSNAVGEGIYSELADEYRGIQNTKIFNNLTFTWDSMEANVNSYNAESRFYTLNGLSVGVWNYKHGIELALMKNLSNYYQIMCYLYKYGWSGSALQTVSSNGTWNPAAVGSGALFTYANSFYTTASPQIRLFKPIPDVIVWIQGESDNPNYATYGTALNNYITQQRSFYNNQNIPFIVVSLSNLQTVINSTNLQGIKTAQRSVSSTLWNNGIPTTNSGSLVLPHVHYLEQNNSTRDNLHYSEIGLINIANSIFEIITIIKPI